MNGSVRPSVCPSVCLSHLFDYVPNHRIIMNFSGVITSDKSDVHANGQGQRSKVKVTEVTTQLNRFRTVTPVWIHMWWWNDAYSLIMLRRGALLFFKVIHQISRSHGSKNCRIWPIWAFPDCNSSLNSPMATKCCTKLEVAYKRCPIVFEGHPSNLRSRGSKNCPIWPKLGVSGLQLQFEFTYDDEMMHIAWYCLGEVPYCFWRSSVEFQGHTAKKIVDFDPYWAFPDCNSSLNSPMATKWCTKLEVS